MKSPIKVLFVVLFALILLALLAWTGTFLYWHFRISRAIQDIELVRSGKKPEAAYGPSYDLLLRAGCRSLPYLVDNMDATKPLWVLTELQFFIRQNALPFEDSDNPLEATLGLFHIDSLDSPELIRSKCEGLRTWWKESGSRYHQWWRVWSGECR